MDKAIWVALGALIGSLVAAIAVWWLFVDTAAPDDCTAEIVFNQRGFEFQVGNDTTTLSVDTTPEGLEKLSEENQKLFQSLTNLCRLHKADELEDNEYTKALVAVIESSMPAKSEVPTSDCQCDLGRSEADTLPTLALSAHVQTLGDIPGLGNAWVGTKGLKKRLEQFSIRFAEPNEELEIEYMCHVQGSGDSQWRKEGEACGTRGEQRRLEGFAVRLRGPEAGRYSVNYQCHTEGQGDSVVRADGAYCGTRGQGRRLEALKVWISQKSLDISLAPQSN